MIALAGQEPVEACIRSNLLVNHHNSTDVAKYVNIQMFTDVFGLSTRQIKFVCRSWYRSTSSASYFSNVSDSGTEIKKQVWYGSSVLGHETLL
jgi:hypothetical protein